MAFSDNILSDPLHRRPVSERMGFTMLQTLPLEKQSSIQLVDKAKATTVKEDSQYLAAHPEISDIVDLLMDAILIHKPRSPMKFANAMFRQQNIRALIAKRKHLKRNKVIPTCNWNLEPYRPTDWRLEMNRLKLDDKSEEDGEEESADERCYDDDSSTTESSGSQRYSATKRVEPEKSSEKLQQPEESDRVETLRAILEFSKRDAADSFEDAEFIEPFHMPLLENEPKTIREQDSLIIKQVNTVIQKEMDRIQNEESDETDSDKLSQSTDRD